MRHIRRAAGALWALVLTLALVPRLALAQSTPQGASLDRVAWMMGCWELRSGSQMTTEMWMPPAGGLMVGGSRTVIAGVAREFEHLRIAARGDTLVYSALPSGQ